MPQGGSGAASSYAKGGAFVIPHTQMLKIRNSIQEQTDPVASGVGRYTGSGYIAHFSTKKT